MNRAFRWLAALFVAPEPENSRIAAAETAQDRREGRLPINLGTNVKTPHGYPIPDGYHSQGCLMRFEVERPHHDCPCECHR